MKQRILAILLSLTMMFTLVPTAMAEGEMAEAPAVTKVAKVGDVEYATLVEAVEAATDGATITLLKDAELTETLNINKAITLDGANHKITGNASAGKTSFITVETDGDFTMKNATILPTSDVEANPAIDLQVKGKVVVDNCVFGAADDTNQFMYNGLEFSQSEDYPMADGTTISNCTFYGGAFRHNFISFYRIAEGATININGNKFLNANWNDTNAIRVSNYSNVNATINLLDDTYSDHGDDENKAYAGLLCFQELSSYNDNFTKLTVNIEKLDTTGAQSDQLFYVYKDSIISTNQPVVKGDSSIEKFFAAKVGDTYYKTLAEAIDAASDGATITLLKDVTGMAVIPSGKTVTIDLSGHTITRTVTSGENSKIYPALYVNGGTLTLDDTSEGKTGRVLSEITDTTVSGAMSNAVYVISGAFTLKNGALAATAAAAPANNTWDTAYGVYVNKSTFTMENGSVTVTAPDGGAYGIAILGPNGVFTMNDGAVTADGFAISGNGSSGVGDTKITINKGTVTGGTLAIYHPQSGELKINGGTLTGKGGIETKAGNTTVSIDGNPTIVATGTPSHSINNNGNSSEGYAISVVENKNYAGGANVSIASGYYKGEVRILVDNEVAADKKGSIIISGGLFSSEPAEKYIAENHYVDASNNGNYPYTVKEGTKPAGALIVVKDTTAVTVPDSEAIKGLTNDDKTNIANKSSVDGVAEAIADNKADLIPADVNTTDAKKVEIEVTVKVNVTSADMTSENKTLTFEASPVATVTVTKADGSTEVKNDVKVPNSLLNDEITVKLPLPAGFTPKQIKHISSDGSVEYFLKTAKRGAKLFTVDSDNCAVFTITKFSTFELSGTVTYVEPSYYSGSSSDPTYSVTVDKTENGSVTVSPKSVSKGDTVTVTVKPDSGYVLETLTVTDKNGNELTLKDKGDGKYTFTMPAGKVEVKATFMEDNSVLNFFYDVPNGAYFYEAVKWAVKSGVTNGLSDTMFGPYESCTRAQIVTFLWRAAGSPEPKTASSFTDVPVSTYYAKAVAWAVENGITNGMTATEFAPDATCTRGQSVTFLYRALGKKVESSANFTDVKSDAFYADAVNWAVASDVTNGTSNTTFSPNADCTRAEIVTFLYRAYQGK